MKTPEQARAEALAWLRRCWKKWTALIGGILVVITFVWAQADAVSQWLDSRVVQAMASEPAYMTLDKRYVTQDQFDPITRDVQQLLVLTLEDRIVTLDNRIQLLENMSRLTIQQRQTLNELRLKRSQFKRQLDAKQ